MSALIDQSDLAALSIRVRGVVQGVGFRPTVARIARELGLAGEVANDGRGVRIYVEGPSVAGFVDRLIDDPPPLARIDSVDVRPVNVRGYQAFVISRSGGDERADTGVPADAAMCIACRDEVLDPYERRYRYPFTNCTHCGPRLSIIDRIPYDRKATSMRSFKMCPECQAEYDDQSNRRYHAQPIACHRCGPKVWLERADGAPVVSDMFSGLDDIDAACTLLKMGEIVALRGLGGYHLACDATRADAVMRLRTLKCRPHKPFALMARDREVIEYYAHLDAVEWQAMSGSSSPIVLLRPRRHEQARRSPKNVTVVETGGGVAPALGREWDRAVLASEIAPKHNLLGFMLPYTPLHALLLRRMDVPVVMTSGNRVDEPQSTSIPEARERLSGIADYFLHHDRDIVDRVDDSVTRQIAGQVRVLRHGRGFAPASHPVRPGPQGLAMGGDLKSTIAVKRNDDVVLSQHIGDLDEPTTRDDYERVVDRYLRLYQVRPEWVAVDCHPGYISRRIGSQIANEWHIPLVEVQHHHAHVVSCLLDNRIDEPVVAVVLDGLGWGGDGTLWGAELLVADREDYERLGSLSTIPLLGGDRVAQEPWRSAYSHLATSIGLDQVASRALGLGTVFARRNATLDELLSSDRPMRTSSAGRLFDAVAAVLGLAPLRQDYEGQAATALEACASTSGSCGSYPFDVRREESLTIDPLPMWRALLGDIDREVSVAQMARRFHEGLATALAEAAAVVAAQVGLSTVALSGGCLANRIVSESLEAQLRSRDLNVLTHRRLPSGDGGLAVGQAVVAANRARRKPCV